jgi:hypothetical protein
LNVEWIWRGCKAPLDSSHYKGFIWKCFGIVLEVFWRIDIVALA